MPLCGFTDSKGCYTKTSRFGIDRVENAVLVYESALYAEQVPTIAISLIQSNPAFFPFEIEAMTGVRLAQLNSRVEVSRYGLDDELLVLTNKKGPRAASPGMSPKKAGA